MRLCSNCVQGERSVQLADHRARLQRGADGPEGGGVRLTRQDFRNPLQWCGKSHGNRKRKSYIRACCRAWTPPASGPR